MILPTSPRSPSMPPSICPQASRQHPPHTQPISPSSPTEVNRANGGACDSEEQRGIYSQLLLGTGAIIGCVTSAWSSSSPLFPSSGLVPQTSRPSSGPLPETYKASLAASHPIANTDTHSRGRARFVCFFDPNPPVLRLRLPRPDPTLAITLAFDGVRARTEAICETREPCLSRLHTSYITVCIF